MYVRVMPSGAISFRLDYRLNGRRETVYLGRYGRDGISLALAREKCLDARRLSGFDVKLTYYGPHPAGVDVRRLWPKA